MKKLAIKLLLVSVLTSMLIGFPAHGQTPAPAPAPAIGPATGGPSKTMLDNALTPQTRQTLQEAMDSFDTDTPATAATASGHVLTIGPGEGAELDGTKANRVPYTSLPAPLRAALAGGVRSDLGGGK